jgi:hypothetical protein
MVFCTNVAMECGMVEHHLDLGYIQENLQTLQVG